MNRINKVVTCNITLIGLIVLSVLFVDRPLSVFIADNLSGVQPLFYNITAVLDKYVGNIFWLPLLSIILAPLFLFNNKTKIVSFILITLSFASITSSAITSIVKSEVKRERPEKTFQVKGPNAEPPSKRIANDSFPSGHSSFYLSLFLPAALAFRRYAFLFLLIPGVIIVGRVVLNEHYLGDVLCSVLIVLNLCYIAFSFIFWLDKTLQNLKLNNKLIKINKFGV